MSRTQRRTFLKMMGAAAATMPVGIERALAIPANDRTRSIRDVEHIVILMQENRSFDHYFGTLKGVRGFGDPRAVKLPSGKPVWFQPTPSGELLPFRPPVPSLGDTFLSDPPHGWNDTHAAWNGGRHDQWVPNKGAVAMTHQTRSDIPYHFALADAFTICDAYHCSVMGPTDPNRYHMWSGWVGNDGSGGGPVITNAEVGYDWSTYPERLERAGISWKVYQDSGVGLTAAGFWGWTGDKPYVGNFGDNALLYFHQYQSARPGNPLADKAKTGTTILDKNMDPNALFEVLRKDVREGKLPQVSYIVAPEAYSEHPNWTPNFGAWYISQVIDILTSNPEVWSKTVLFLNYDEEGGFFDHMVPPTPPANAAGGLSTVSTVNEIYTAGQGHPDGPYGLGMRVPMIVISPWSKGGWVNSQVFDHTSLIRFIEARFGDEHPELIESNITPWRREVAGDLTSTLDFERPNEQPPKLPSTVSFKPASFDFHPNFDLVPPADQKLPTQETGVRHARALPYSLTSHADVIPAEAKLGIAFANIGRATAVFHVRSGNAQEAPRSFTVQPGKELSDKWNAAGGYDVAVHGPNGFLRGFKGAMGDGSVRLAIREEYDTKRKSIALAIRNQGLQPGAVRVIDGYTGQRVMIAIQPGQVISRSWNLERLWGWYDLVITADGDPQFRYQFAGHVETGEHSISDPALGGVRLDADEKA
jgi:phospholipase C